MAHDMTVACACVIGHRVGYSRSPALYGYWLHTLGLEGRYDLVDLAPEAFAAFLGHLAAHGYVGANVTKPHKQAAFELLDDRDAAADAIGAVNTVWLDGDRLIGSNTDAGGFLANLDAQVPGWDGLGGPVVVLGAGGAARAVVYGLRTRKLDVVVVNRTLARAETLAHHFGTGVASYPWSQTPTLVRAARLLVNATLLGATGQEAPAIELSHLPAEAVVCDLNYMPLESELLRAARLRGLRTADGLGMLMHQAVPAFERFFGARPAVTPQLRAALEATFFNPDAGR
jgi:shikimate dehydrogenase